RDRQDDIPLLAAHFAEKYVRPGHPMPQFSPEAMESIITYSWPGNIRQLENAIERAVVTAREGVIAQDNLPGEVGRPVARKPVFAVDLSRTLPEQLKELTVEYEKRFLRRALKKARGHVGRSARITGLSRRSVTTKLSQYNIDPARYKKD